MTQRIFDRENEKDMADLWDILPDSIDIIRKINRWDIAFLTKGNGEFRISSRFIRIEWHDKTEITRPMQEATEADVGKICYFWDDDVKYPKQIGLLSEIKTNNSIFKYVLADSVCFAHCRRLTKQEVEKLI